MDNSPVGEQFVPSELFDEDYEYFYADRLRPERSELEAARILQLVGLGPGDGVLDLPCGDGRIAVFLVQAGCWVVGVDQNEDLIIRAKEREVAGARFEIGDMRAPRWQSQFECVVNWFGSFGYFDTDTNRRVLHGFSQALRPGGRVIIDQVNPAQVRQDVDRGRGAALQMIERGLDLMLDRVRVLDGRARTERFLVRNGRVRKMEFSLELIDDDLLANWLHEAGFEGIRFLDQAGEPYTAGSRRRITVAQRAGG